ncbi:MAG: hypothetical protein GHCLOJNM_03953 [bacterium]|nr:hypothetical protein [bacterium]
MPAGDFYFAINATFRFLLERFGEEALVEYWRAMGKDYFAPLSQRFREGGLAEVERYWRDFFKAEPGGLVEVRQEGDRVEIEVHECPAIGWLRAAGREVVPCYCLHCHHVNRAIAEDSGFTFALQGGGGSCHQTFRQSAERRA